MKYGIGIFAFVVVVILVGVLIQQRSSDSFDLPQGGESVVETIMVPKKDSVTMEEKEILVTDGVKHSLPLNEIVTLLPADQIPSIDNPKFVSLTEADKWLNEEEPGIAFSRGTTHRFYPYQILVWHEIVNDVIPARAGGEGQRVAVTYCPLCLTGYVLDSLVQGERVEFGTSGKLWKSNLIMYDRKTNSLWSQVLAEAIVGEMTGTELEILSSDQMRYGAWKKKYPEGQVLSRETGTIRLYGSNPYDGGYFKASSTALSLTKDRDARLSKDAFVFGVVVNDKAKAYLVAAAKEKGTVTDTFEGKTFVLSYDAESDVVRMFEKLADGREQRINPVSGFWFSWAAVHPDTEVYK